MSTPEHILKQYWGYDEFRPLQRSIIGSILAGTDTLALLPTGGGKSVCYQVPALVAPGLCLVISPLIALMQDQVSRLQQLGVAASCLHSGMHYNEVKQTLSRAVAGDYKLLYLSPERLQTRLFTDYLKEMDVSMIAVDEAHCISQWGHDFRPSYLLISDIRYVFPNVPVLALTATATPAVQNDIVTSLRMKQAAVFKMSFARNNIHYAVNYSENKTGDTLQSLATGCSIVYCRSRKQTENIGAYLNSNNSTTAVYHAGLSRDLRNEAQRQWMEGDVQIMAATTAFGMGIDKPDVRHVIHFDAPEHPEAYYQEAGRAGRDGLPSMATALYNNADIKRLYDSTALHYPPEAYLRQVYQSVVEYLQVPIAAQPDKYFAFDLEEFCSRFKLRPTEAIHALKLLEREGLWTLTDAVFRPATVQFLADRHTLDSLQNFHPKLAYVSVGLLRMYSSIFHFPTRISETAVARQLRISRYEVMQALSRMVAMGVLEYNKPGDGPQLFFHHYRVDSTHLLINMRRIELLRKRHEERTAAMIAYLQNTTICRERLLLRYFGEQADADCGHCDVCAISQHQTAPLATIKNELKTYIMQHAPIAPEVILATFPPAIRDTVLQLIRKWTDEGHLYYDGTKLHIKQ